MSAQEDTTREAAAAQVMAAPARFEFVRAVAALQAAAPAAAPIGHLGPPEREAVRLRPALSLGFPTADLCGIQPLPPGPAGPRWVLDCCFLGTYGQASPLPAYFTESLMGLEDPAPVRDWLDLFNHRLLSLAYRVMTKYRLADGQAHEGRLLALIGQAAPPHAEGHAEPRADAPVAADELMPPRLLLACAGLMSQQPRSADALERVLAVWMGVPVAIEQCVERWVALPHARQTRLGAANASLGVDAIAGAALRDRSTSFRVRVGPVGGAALRRLLPGGSDRGVLQALVAEFNAGMLDWELEVLVPPAELPPAALGAEARLGWDTRMAGGDGAPVPIRFGMAA